MQEFFDLRSDTGTVPDEKMRDLIRNAEVGDDVLGEDPSCNELETYAAKLFGKEAALFLPSGTMANQVAVKCHTKPGNEIIVHNKSHIFNNEGGALALLSSVQAQALANEKGYLEPEQILKAIRSSDIHHPPTTLICLENSCERNSGNCYPFELLKEIRKVSKEKNIPIHVDGARFWNTAISQDHSLDFYEPYYDTMSVCLSKGLGAPVGSLLLGSSQLIKEARFYRKTFGGGMRQAGFLAKAGLYAIKNNFERLQSDHLLAKQIASLISQSKSFELVNPNIETNIVYFKPISSEISALSVKEKLKEHRILLHNIGCDHLRIVTSSLVGESILPCLKSALDESI